MSASCQERTHAPQQKDIFDHFVGAGEQLSGMSRPSALAVLRLITSSYLVGACTGKSAGFSPSGFPFIGGRAEKGPRAARPIARFKRLRFDHESVQ